MKTLGLIVAILLVGTLTLNAEAGHWVVTQVDTILVATRPAKLRQAERLQARADRAAAAGVGVFHIQTLSASCDLAASCDVAANDCDVAKVRHRVRKVRVYEQCDR